MSDHEPAHSPLRSVPHQSGSIAEPGRISICGKPSISSTTVRERELYARDGDGRSEQARRAPAGCGSSDCWRWSAWPSAWPQRRWRRGRGASGTALSLPGSFIANYGHRAKPCRDLVTPPWVSWISYANGTIGDQWRVYATSSALCRVARITSDAVISDAPYDDGAGQVLTRQLAFALHHHGPRLSTAPRPAGRRWSCEVLPSLWGQQAWDLARLAHHPGAPQPSDFAAASGPAAGAGFCDTRTRRNAGRPAHRRPVLLLGSQHPHVPAPLQAQGHPRPQPPRGLHQPAVPGRSYGAITNR